MFSDVIIPDEKMKMRDTIIKLLNSSDIFEYLCLADVYQIIPDTERDDFYILLGVYIRLSQNTHLFPY